MSGNSIKKVMGEIFGLAPGEIPDHATMEELEGWDSLNHMELMLAIEIEYGVRISTTLMLEFVSLDSIQDFLKSQGVDAG
jgi:acyl carrier protein